MGPELWVFAGLVAFAGAAAGIGIAAVRAARHERSALHVRRTLALDETSRALGLTQVRISSSPPILDAQSGWGPLRIEWFVTSNGKTSVAHTRWSVGTRIPTDLTIAPEGPLRILEKALSGEDLLTGDEPWDKRVRVHARDPIDALARLGFASRRAIAHAFLAKYEGRLDQGVAVIFGPATDDAAGLISGAQCVLSMVHALDDPRPVDERLAAIIAGDPCLPVRRRALEALLLGRATPAAKNGLSAAITAADPLLLLRAAPFAPDEAALPLARLAFDGEAEPDLRRAAIEISARNATDETVEWLGRLLSPDHVSVVPAALDALWKLGRVPRVEVLAKLCEEPSFDAPAKVAFAAALGASGREGAEVVARSLLADETPAVAIAAARGLEKIGTIASVQALRDRAEGLLVSRELKEAVRSAVEAIQARSGAESGGLSLADPDPKEGALSVAEGSPGALSEVED
jgi:hypothetical protein